MTVEWWAWAAVISFILAMLAVDLLFFHREAHEVSIREAAIWSGIWVAHLPRLRGDRVGDARRAGGRRVHRRLRHREEPLRRQPVRVRAPAQLLRGADRVPAPPLVLGRDRRARGARRVFIFAGVALLETFHWMIYVFGALLVITGARMASRHDTELHPEHNPVLNACARSCRSPTTTSASDSSSAGTAGAGSRRCSPCWS